MTENNGLVGGLLGEQFKMNMMVTQIPKEEPKTSEGIQVSLPVEIPETHNNTEDKGSMDSMVEPKKTVIHQQQIPGRH